MPTRDDRERPTAGAPAVVRRRMTRPATGRLLAGVGAGLADHLGLERRVVRIALVLLNLAGGAGIAVYLLLWILTPETGDEPARDDSRPPLQFILAGVALLVLGGLLAIGQGSDVGRSLGDILPVLAVAVGAVVAWSEGEESRSWLGRRGGLWRAGGGVALAVTGFVVLATRGQGVAMAWDVLVATIAVLGGVGLLLAPWAMRFWQRYQDEQTTRIRETERADIAAHLHDSVLQTLALIQRTDDPARVARLARAQERELRAWLYGGRRSDEETLAAAVTAAAHETEDLHGVPIDLVVTGDRPLDESGTALVRALREALHNAVRHGAPPVSAYVEVGPRLVEAFIRDHGPGFDLDDVPADRLGVRESILGRMGRHGGSARIRRLEEGTEVVLELPVEPPDGPGPGSTPEPTPQATPEPTPQATPAPDPQSTPEAGGSTRPRPQESHP